MVRLEVEPNLTLELLNTWDCKAMYALVDANREHLAKWLFWVDSTNSEEVYREFVESTLRTYLDQSGFVYKIIHQGRLVGCCGIRRLRENVLTYALGYWLSADHTGRGVMTKCSRTLTKFCFDELKAEKVEIHCAVGNNKSIAIPTRLGFKEEGVIRKVQRVCDQYQDHHFFGMLKEEADLLDKPLA